MTANNRADASNSCIVIPNKKGSPAKEKDKYESSNTEGKGKTNSRGRKIPD